MILATFAAILRTESNLKPLVTSIAILEEVIADEREHYQTLGNLIRSRRPLPAMPPEQAQEALDNLVADCDKGRTQAAGWVGGTIYGVNDGLGSIFGIVSGVSGAAMANSHFVLIAGLDGMVASALSMGSGAYLAAKSEWEIFEAEFAREREAVEDNEAEAREVLSLSYGPDVMLRRGFQRVRQSQALRPPPARRESSRKTRVSRPPFQRVERNVCVSA